ncbi:SDR family NAD(P)-dependent oxidoreductase, partial [Candidatus Dependentiae bacterium]|nr:SDR family NAD(P)-dependent oxidoreductase [Candidatus Dependentiae bacterium]
MTQGRVQKKVALITGAAQGIGKETAIVLAREGAIVVVSDINDSLGQMVAKEIGGECIYLHLDVANEDDWKQAISTITEK